MRLAASEEVREESAMSNGEDVRTVINHVPAVSCIQLPTLEMIEAIQRSRNRLD